MQTGSDLKWNFTAASVGQFFGVADRTIRQWVSEGMPRAAHGKYNLIDCFAWWQENINKPASGAEADARERYWFAKADREELAVKQLQDKVIERSEVEKEWCFRLQEVIKGIESQEVVFPDLFAGKSKDEIRDLVKKYNRRLRENYAREGRFTPVKMPEIEENKPVRRKKGKR